MKQELPEDLLKILACPICKSRLDYKKEKNILRCNKCQIDFPIKEGIPHLLPPEKKKK
ncbi:Trm112 family protein [Candidatus Woesearchaeota archaeon]|nr:Trm112 family protein [Candidatus Woesearchaeota archaeon]